MKFFYFSPFLKVAFPIHFQISISHQDSSRTCIARSITVSLVWLVLDTRQPWPCLRGQTANHQVAAGPFCAHGLRPRSRQRQPTPTNANVINIVRSSLRNFRTRTYDSDSIWSQTRFIIGDCSNKAKRFSKGDD
jgi:hypothetical protein